MGAAVAGVSAFEWGLLAISAATTAYSVDQGKKATASQQVELDLAKRQESQAAQDRELQRNRRINAILGAQNAQAAASGVANSGSVANISLQDAKLAGEDSSTDALNTRTRIDALSRQRTTIGSVGRARTATSIMKLAETGYSTFGK